MVMTLVTQKQPVGERTPGHWPTGDLPFEVEKLDGHRTGQVYRLCSAPAHHWIGIDDLEFIAPDPLTSDEMAQCIFQLTGGSGQARSTFGQTAHYHVFYDAEQPGRLRLEVKPNYRAALPTGNPFSIQPDLGSAPPSSSAARVLP